MRSHRPVVCVIPLAGLVALASAHCGSPPGPGESVQVNGEPLTDIAQIVDIDFQGMYAEMQQHYGACVSQAKCPAKSFPSTSACIEVAKLSPGSNPFVNPIVFYGGAIAGSEALVGQQLGGDWVFDIHHAQAASFWYLAAGAAVALDATAGVYDGIAFTSNGNVLDAWSGQFKSASAGLSLFGLVGASGTGFASPQLPPQTFGVSVGISVGTPTDPLPVTASAEPGTWYAWDFATEGIENELAWAPFLGHSLQHQGGHDYVAFGSPAQTAAAVAIYGGPQLGVLAAASLGATAFSNHSVTYQQVCTPAPSAPTKCGVLQAGQGLLENVEVQSCDGRFTLIQQTDGNLVLYRTSGSALWSSRTSGKRGYASVLQADGNFVVYTDGNAPLWASNTARNAGDHLAIQDDGNVVIYSPSGKVLWATNTAQPAPPPPPPRGELVACNAAGQAMDANDGVIAYCDDGAGSGEYQCDQYANRAMSALDLPPVDDWATNLACEICDLVTRDPTLDRLYSVWGPGYRSPAGHAPAANDLLVWTETTGCDEANKWSPGHVAVVTGADRNYVQYIQQNWMVGESVGGSAYAGLVRSATAWDAASSFFGNPGNPDGSPNAAYVPKCWVHPECPSGTSCNPGPSHNPCRRVTHANNGQYCGTSTQAGFDGANADHGTVYECFDGQIADELHCPTGCDVAGPGHADGCKDPCLDVPASENGLYCGSATAFGFNRADANAGWLYTCTNGKSAAASTANCGGSGCTVNANGADGCTPHASTDPCADVPAAANGAYCSSSTQAHFDPARATPPGAVYTCENGVTLRKALCGGFGCTVNASGADTCEPTSDPCANVPAYENGTFCGLSTEWGFQPSLANDRTLYACADGHMVQSSACAAGCFVNPQGPDACN